MNLQIKIVEIVADILELELGEVALETELNGDNWDSLAVVTFISEVDTEFGKVVSPKDVTAASSVKELLDLIK